ncbi:MAG: GGDEF domain-containing protein [Candidatus Gracilibacteria bacterium]|nr:GGDEF domain-containing protein [Candidatus Gracilibacteria bacterium]
MLSLEEISSICDYISLTIRNLGHNEYNMINNEHLQNMNNIDALTGAFNRRFLFTEIEKLVSLHKRNSQPMSVLMLDLDHFKNLNDTYGHEMGDIVLEEFVRQVTYVLRESDILARYGGEEFTIILPETGEKGAIEVANKILESTRTMKVRDKIKNEDIKITVSIGIKSRIPGGEMSGKNMIKKADDAVYEAKEKGRNRFCIYKNSD